MTCITDQSAEHYAKLKQRGIKTILGTLGNLDLGAEAPGHDQVYAEYGERGTNIIDTDGPIEAAAVIHSD